MAKARKKAASKGPVPQVGGINLPAGFKQKRQVILPTLNITVGEPRTLTFLEAMRVSTMKQPEKNARAKPKKGAAAGESAAPMEPATVCPVRDEGTGELFNMLVPAVLKGNLEESYPEQGYVGLTFYVDKLPKRPGKRYFDFRLVEVEK